MSIPNAKQLLVHYFEVAFRHAGKKWDRDYTAEVEAIVDEIVEAAVKQTLDAVVPRFDTLVKRLDRIDSAAAEDDAQAAILKQLATFRQLLMEALAIVDGDDVVDARDWRKAAIEALR